MFYQVLHPCRVRPNQPTVFVLLPENADSYQFLVNNSWMAMADGYKLNFVLAGPGNGTCKSLRIPILECSLRRC
ncbi:MAG: hypothetical protein PWP25_1536 [Sphaerochaeta sp.]|jgi:hypothetical protein|nr:hypothetical protein [Sphaerochaeta sp.]